MHYRFGFNGQEKENEISGTGNHNTAQFWEYDTRLGRRWNVDPAFRKSPNISPFASFFNNPNIFPDKKGDFPGESFIYDFLNKKNGLLVLFNESHVTAGISGLFAYGMQQSGRVYDKKGVTFFDAVGYDAGFKNKENESLVVGADIDVFDIGFFRSVNGKQGTDFLNGTSPISVDVTVADLSFNENGYGASIGVGAGFGIVQLNYTKYNSYSISVGEQSKVLDMLAADEMLDADKLSLGKQTDIKDAKGNIIGQQAELMVRTKTHWWSSKEENKATGVIMKNYSTDKDKQEWKSDTYNSQHEDKK